MRHRLANRLGEAYTSLLGALPNPRQAASQTRFVSVTLKAAEADEQALLKKHGII